jgi:hypothetical protein
VIWQCVLPATIVKADLRLWHAKQVCDDYSETKKVPFP